MNTISSRGTRLSKLPGALLLATLVSLAACEEPPPPVPPKPVKALRIIAPDSLAEGSFPGLAAATQEVNLSFRVTGPLVELPIKVGDTVKAGTMVARIDPNDFQVALRNAQSVQAAADAAARRAAADYQRLLNAQQEDPGATSQRAVDRALAARDETRAAASAAAATVQIAQDRLSYTRLIAPFSGTVVETYVENFETVIALKPIVRLIDNSDIEMTLAIPENLIGYADYVTDISVTYDALPGIEVPAVISEIGTEATQATRTYPLTIVMAQPEQSKILPGMAGQARIRAQLPESASGGVHVPPTALFADTSTEQSFVWIIENDKVSRREVQTGDLTTTGVLVTGGLKADELIVATGVSALSDGQDVTIIDVGESQ